MSRYVLAGSNNALSHLYITGLKCSFSLPVHCRATPDISFASVIVFSQSIFYIVCAKIASYFINCVLCRLWLFFDGCHIKTSLFIKRPLAQLNILTLYLHYDRPPK